LAFLKIRYGVRSPSYFYVLLFHYPVVGMSLPAAILNFKDKITNKELWNMAEQDSMETTITRRKWTWIGHTMRKAGSSITKQESRAAARKPRDAASVLFR